MTRRLLQSLLSWLPDRPAWLVARPLASSGGGLYFARRQGAERLCPCLFPEEREVRWVVACRTGPDPLAMS
jgi:hypothetical protein